ncbi:hypothetical protein DERF_013131 [Dermatophagoides farinae]|uniref:Secreted protein n=1 Tax=Dermatophagoides farinae TaxID=6954 RepID=A0A922HL54_DERFA|nr:hypothetical protein DERF_013131 [Dermatophagoides farinae]
MKQNEMIFHFMIIEKARNHKKKNCPVLILLLHFFTCKSCLAASAPALVENVTKPTGDDVFPFLLVTFNNDPSYPYKYNDKKTIEKLKP